MKYIKMNGAGNDYIFFDFMKSKCNFNPEKLSPVLSDRKNGIGSDGIILIKKSNRADCFMDIYNADGSRAKMCGNGIRCVAQYINSYYFPEKKEVHIETLSGIKKVKILENNGKTALSSVSMGKPTMPIVQHKYFDCLNDCLKYFLVGTGNLHAVCFANNLIPEKFQHIALELQRKHKNVNVEFVNIKENQIKARVFENGSGETLACGTGATAIATVLNFLENKESGNYPIIFPGGKLLIQINEDKEAILVGKSELTYIGNANLKNFLFEQ